MDEEFGNKVLQQLMDLYVTPEIRRRQESGLLPSPFDLHAAQIIFSPDGKLPTVRLNSEIKAIGHIKLKKGVTKNAGDPIFEGEIEGLDKIELSDQSDLNCGHATIMRVLDR